jgi:preprotein translocase subunit SecF
MATSISTLLAIAALLFFGGDNLFGFSIACSSVFWRVPTRRSTSPTWC